MCTRLDIILSLSKCRVRCWLWTVGCNALQPNFRFDCINYPPSRVISMMIDIPLWSFVLSTRKPRTILAPPATRHPSSRIRMDLRILVRPFFAFTTDLGQRTRTKTHRSQECELAVVGFQLGAECLPLWQSYGDNDESPMSSIKIRSMVLSKQLEKTSPPPTFERGVIMYTGHFVCTVDIDLVLNDDEALQILRKPLYTRS